MNAVSSRKCPVLFPTIGNRQSKIENCLGFRYCFRVRSVGCWVQAQQTGKILRIGFLDSSTASGIAVLLEAFDKS